MGIDISPTLSLSHWFCIVSWSHGLIARIVLHVLICIADLIIREIIVLLMAQLALSHYLNAYRCDR